MMEVTLPSSQAKFEHLNELQIKVFRVDHRDVQKSLDLGREGQVRS